jgi:hypothetical protein
MRKPNNIQSHLQVHVDNAIIKILTNTKYEELIGLVKGHIADVVRGKSYSNYNMFTVPYWAYKPDTIQNRKTNGGYFIYYVAHELAHIITYSKYGGGCSHNSNFYEIFMEICPKEYQHFELNYKKTAAKYGISKK